MKRWARVAIFGPSHPFSILYRIEWVETPWARTRTALIEPFSILYRIEWVETGSVGGPIPVSLSFSILYRIEWVETSIGARRPGRTGLSVSCIGSNGLKLDMDDDVTVDVAAFSILYRIEWVETVHQPERDGHRSTFQYPVSDRMG